MKKEREDWMRIYHKTLKELETMIDVQKMVKDIKKIAEKVNTMITKMEGTILIVSINNRMTNAMNITKISKDLWYIVQSNIEDQAFQTQRILVNELDRYKGRDNYYVNKNIQEIQQLYIDKEISKKNKERMEDEEVILIKPYKVLESISTKSLSFIDKKIDNLLKYLKFVKSSIQTRLF